MVQTGESDDSLKSWLDGTLAYICVRAVFEVRGAPALALRTPVELYDLAVTVVVLAQTGQTRPSGQNGSLPASRPGTTVQLLDFPEILVVPTRVSASRAAFQKRINHRQGSCARYPEQ